MNQDTATATPQPLAAGSSIGHYNLVRELGVGGMGSVFLAEDGRLERKVALKFLTSQLAQNEEFRQRFMREAKSAAKLNHTNIVTVYEVGEDADRVFIAMEYVEGRSLREMIDTRALSYDQALETFTQLCTGLKKAHDAGIVHRDLKPANIMVTGDKEVKILDFGLAKGTVDGNLTSTGTALGTVNYMSPEQAQGTNADHRSDLFSAGILLFELLSGVNPFVRGYMPATIHAIVYEPAGLLAGYNSELPPGCQIIVDKALAKKPEDRYQSIDELLSDLGKLKAGQAITPAAVAQPSTTPSDKLSLAVLCLENLGPESDEHLSHGITEDLIIDLSRVGSFKVVPMYKVKKYKNSELDPSEIARQLNVSLVLDGSLHRSDTSIRVGAQLVDVNKDEIVWSNRWEVSADQIGRIKTALAEGISGALSLDSSVIRQADLGKSDTSNPEAYDLYLKGKYALEKRKKRADVETAREHFKKALDLEPTLLAARVGLAETHNVDLQLDEARELLTPALEDAQRRGLKAEEALVRMVLGITENRSRNFDRSFELLGKAAEMFRELRDINGEARALSEVIRPLLNSGRDAEVPVYEERIGELAQAGADAVYISMALLGQGVAHMRLKDNARGLGLMQDALQLARANDVKVVAYRVLEIMARHYSHTGGSALETAMAYIEEARFIVEKLDDKFGLWNIEFTSFFMEFLTGAFRQSLDKVDRLITTAEEVGDIIGRSSLEWAKGVLLYFTGDYEGCIAQTEEMRRVAQHLDPKLATDRLAAADLLSGLGHFMLGREQEAMDLLRRSRSGFGQLDNCECEVECLALGGEMLLATGKREEARKDFETAIEKARGAEDVYCIAVSRGMLALMSLQDGDGKDAFARLRKNVEDIAGHFAELTARRLLGHALLAHGSTEQEREEGRRTLLQALNLARKQENAVEITRIQEVLERHG